MLPPPLIEHDFTVVTVDGVRITGKRAIHPQASATAILAHPHPRHGGTMDNKVITTAARAAAAQACNTLRFNFRGVGASEGAYAGGRGEVLDLAAVHNARPAQSETILIGFSFGAIVSARFAQQWQQGGVIILIAPPLSPPHDAESTAWTLPRLSPALWRCAIVLGDRDPLCAPEQAASYLTAPGALHVIAGAAHFFDGQLPALANAVAAIIAG